VEIGKNHSGLGGTAGNKMYDINGKIQNG